MLPFLRRHSERSEESPHFVFAVVVAVASPWILRNHRSHKEADTLNRSLR
jgi:hypothetical protein